MTAVFAHRGCTEGFAENTLEAFAEARRLGADGVELDVRLTADGALAIHHDADIPGLGPWPSSWSPTCPPTSPCWPTPWPSARAWWSTSRSRTRRGPGLDPSEAVAALTAAAIDEAGWTSGSWSRPSRRHAAGGPGGGQPAGAGHPVGLGDEAEAALARAAEAGCGAVHPFVSSVDPELVERAHAAGLAVNVWTVNAPDDLRGHGGVGVDGVITDPLGDALAIARGARGGTGAAPEKRLLTGPNGGGRPWSSKMVGHERRRLCQTDPRSGRPGALNPGTKTLDRSGKLIMDDSDNYGVEMALQLASGEGDEVTLVSMAPGGETSGLRTGLAMGAAKASWSATTLCRQRRPRHGQGPGRRHRAGQPGPGGDGHRVDRRLHRHAARTGGRADGPALGHLRQGHLGRRRLGEGRAPDRRGLRRGGLPAAGRGHSDGRRGRAPLPLVQGDHGGQVEAGRRPDGCRPRHRRVAGRRGRRGPGDHGRVRGRVARGG